MEKIFKPDRLNWKVFFFIYSTVIVLCMASAYRYGLPSWLAIIPWYDKILHFFLVGFFGYIAHRACKRYNFKIGSFTVRLGFFLVFCFFTAEEFIQIFSSHRTFSLADLSANWLGLLFFSRLS